MTSHHTAIRELLEAQPWFHGKTEDGTTIFYFEDYDEKSMFRFASYVAFIVYAKSPKPVLDMILKEQGLLT